MKDKEGVTIKLDIPKLSDLQLERNINDCLSYIDKLNELIIQDESEQYIRVLLNRINRAIEYVEACYMDDKLLKILKGERL